MPPPRAPHNRLLLGRGLFVTEQTDMRLRWADWPDVPPADSALPPGAQHLDRAPQLWSQIRQLRDLAVAGYQVKPFVKQLDLQPLAGICS